jgi:hypothetical protein
LSQQTPPVIPGVQGKDVSPNRSEASTGSAKADPREGSGSNAKPLPFIRPADIYKRMAEEQERERRSQESSRPSIDSARAKSREESPSNPVLRQKESSESIGKSGRKLSMDEDLDASRRLKPMLDPVAERKSEYGFENLLKSQPAEAKPSAPVEPSTTSTRSDTSKPIPQRPELTSNSSDDVAPASSNYSDRSLEGSLPDVQRVSNFEMDFSSLRADGSPSIHSEQPPVEPAATGADLHHQPSLGYRTMVRQAFENETRDIPPTPSSTGESVPRSNSGSTSQISPIINRGPSVARTDTQSFGTEATPTITEEPERASSRPTSPGTIGRSQPLADDSEPLPPPTRPGRRMDRNSPSPGHSPARRAVIGVNPDVHKSEHAEMLVITPTVSQQSNKALPDLPPLKAPESPIPRSESPPKGTVRGLAGRFDQHGGSETSLDHATAPETSRPTAERNESFRPALPGGWVSYAGTPGASTPAADPTSASPQDETVTPVTPRVGTEPVPDFDTTPTAVKKSAPVEEEAKSSLDPFAAAAAAGSALANAFAAASGVNAIESKDSSENAREIEPQRTKGDINPAKHLTLPSSGIESGVESSVSSKPPTPPPKDTPLKNASPKADHGYFPLPLRPKAEPSVDRAFTPERSVPDRSLSVETTSLETESDRLREEIMQTLTPRTSNVEEQGHPDPDQSRQNLNVAPTSREQVESTVLPREYESYWNSTAEENKDVTPQRSGQAVERSIEEPIISPRPEAKDLPSIPNQPEVGSGQQTETRPMIQHRFSWEDSQRPINTHVPEHHLGEDSSSSPNTIRPLNKASVTSPRSPHGEEQMPPVPSYGQTVGGFRPEQVPKTSAVAVESAMPGSSSEPMTHPTSHMNPEYRSSLEADRVSSRDSWNLTQSGVFALSPDAALRSSPDRTPAQRSSVSEPQRVSLDSTRRFFAAPTADPAAQDTQLLPTSPTAEFLSFKKILALKTAKERIDAYNTTRDQFSTLDTGLAGWLSATGQALPEHDDTMTSNGRPLSGGDQAHRPSPARSKFPKIGAFDPSETFRPSHGRQASGSAFGSGKISGQQVQAKSKDLLHTAGVFGGKANTAAKGWLAKGKTKFRSSGGGDKVD